MQAGRFNAKGFGVTDRTDEKNAYQMSYLVSHQKQ